MDVPLYCGDFRLDAWDWPLAVRPVPEAPVLGAGSARGLGLLAFGGEHFAWERRGFDAEWDLGGRAAFPGPGYRCDLVDAGEPSWLPRLSGGRGQIIDFLGIDSLVGGRHRHFRDEVARKVALELMGNPAGWYHRYGVAGLGGHPSHPGGEVVEWNALNAATGAGRSRSHAGHLAADGSAGNAWLAGPGASESVERRSDYSQTIWSPMVPERHSEARAFRVRPLREISLLDVLAELASRLGLEAFGARLIIEADASCRRSHLLGRVLKSEPVPVWRNLDDARDSAVERRVALEGGEKVLALGTYFPRVEPDWEAISSGRPYERRGHFHASLLRPHSPVSARRLKTFHLRDAFLCDDAVATVEIIPASQAVRVHRVELEGDLVLSKSTRRSLSGAPQAI